MCTVCMDFRLSLYTGQQSVAILKRIYMQRVERGETDRQTDRQTDRERQRETDRPRETDRQTDRETDRPREREVSV